MDPAELLKQALALPSKDRAALADSLLESLDQKVDEDAEQAWLAVDALYISLGLASDDRYFLRYLFESSSGAYCKVCAKRLLVSRRQDHRRAD